MGYAGYDTGLDDISSIFSTLLHSGYSRLWQCAELTFKSSPAVTGHIMLELNERSDPRMSTFDFGGFLICFSMRF